MISDMVIGMGTSATGGDEESSSISSTDGLSWFSLDSSGIALALLEILLRMGTAKTMASSKVRISLSSKGKYDSVSRRRRETASGTLFFRPGW